MGLLAEGIPRLFSLDFPSASVSTYSPLLARVALTVVSDLTSCSESDVRVSGWRGFGFNLCVASFPNIYVPNFKLEDLQSELSELARGWSEWSEGVRGSEVLDRI